MTVAREACSCTGPNSVVWSDRRRQTVPDILCLAFIFRATNSPRLLYILLSLNILRSSPQISRPKGTLTFKAVASSIRFGLFSSSPTSAWFGAHSVYLGSMSEQAV